MASVQYARGRASRLARATCGCRCKGRQTIPEKLTSVRVALTGRLVEIDSFYKIAFLTVKSLIVRLVALHCAILMSFEVPLEVVLDLEALDRKGVGTVHEGTEVEIFILVVVSPVPVLVHERCFAFLERIVDLLLVGLAATVSCISSTAPFNAIDE